MSNSIVRFAMSANQDATSRPLTYGYQAPAYASTLAILPAAYHTLVQPATLTGAVTITANTTLPQIGDVLEFAFVADSVGAHIVTFSTGFVESGTLTVAASKYGFVAFIFNGVVWVEKGAALATV